MPRQSALSIIDVQNFCARREGVEFQGLGAAEMAARYGTYFDRLVTLATDACATYTQARHDNALSAISGYCRRRTADDLPGEIAGLDRRRAS